MSHADATRTIGLDGYAAPEPARRRMLRGLLGLSAAALVSRVALAPVSGPAIGPLPRLLPPTATAGAADRAEWFAFRDRFILPEGRVVDTANGGASHSEGQGFAMVLAEWADDRETFERLINWARGNLSRAQDALFSWRWVPGRRVEDPNNATDGDIMIAWALLRAADRWDVPAWRRHAEAITRDILRLSVRQVANRTVLLPGAQGFDKVDRVIVNPSYYNLPAIRALAGLVPSPAWARLEADATWLLDTARFGAWRLPSDWVEIMKADGRLQVAGGWAPRFSWDAVRVPLYLAWAGETTAPALAAAVNFWTQAAPGTIPAWTDLRTGMLAPYPGHAGIVAVAALSAAAKAGTIAAARLPEQARATDYYGGALIMLSRLARQEGAAARAFAREAIAQS